MLSDAPILKPVTFIGSSRDDMRDMPDAVRTVYVSKFADSIYVSYAFQKKTQKTAKEDLELARRRYKLIPGRKP